VTSPDVIVAGAGIIGLSTALELRRRGARVLLLDRGKPGMEASSAAAGMLASADPETPLALKPLAELSARLYPEYVEVLEAVSGTNVDFCRRGTVAIAGGKRAFPEPYRRLTQDELSHLEPVLETQDRPAFFVQEDVVDPALLVRAALIAARQAGVEIRADTAIERILAHNGVIEIVSRTESHTVSRLVNCQGAWSGAPVKPRKGQAMYVLPAKPGLLQHTVVAPEVYLVPRSSGKVYVGATVEDAGYDRTVEPATIRHLHLEAARLIPELAAAKVTESWAGLRPGSPDDLPLLGAMETPGIFIASGHFRNGILLAPLTACIVAELVAGKPSPVDISAFSPLRFAKAASRR
jgi:glycine oxidase